MTQEPGNRGDIAPRIDELRGEAVARRVIKAEVAGDARRDAYRFPDPPELVLGIRPAISRVDE